MNVKLTDEQWQKILPILKTFPEIRLGAGRDVRRFLEAVLWITRSGAQWRLLPKSYGKWNSVYRRFDRWSNQGIFEKLFEHFARDRDLEYLLIDSTIVRAHWNKLFNVRLKKFLTKFSNETKVRQIQSIRSFSEQRH